MNSVLSYGGSIESNRNLRLSFLASHDAPRMDTLDDTMTIPLPGCVVR